MKYVRGKRYRCVKGDGPEDLEEKVNEILEKQSVIETKIDTLVPYLCHIWISCERSIPETLAEEYEVRGEVHCCGECPHLQIEGPRNRKVFPCSYAAHGISKTNSNCCSRFYAEVIEGREYDAKKDGY